MLFRFQFKTPYCQLNLSTDIQNSRQSDLLYIYYVKYVYLYLLYIVLNFIIYRVIYYKFPPLSSADSEPKIPKVKLILLGSSSFFKIKLSFQV